MRPLVRPQPAARDDVEAVWSEWGRITRFLESARVAFERERDLWASLKLVAADDVRFSASAGRTKYRVGVAEHLAAVEDEDTLYASVLIHTYAIAESAAAQRLRDDPRNLGGIEDWGERLLAGADESWESVKGGLAGAVEVAIVRNAYAHGSRRIDRAAAKRLRAVELTHRRDGDPVTLDYATLRVFRARLRDLLNVGGIGNGG